MTHLHIPDGVLPLWLWLAGLVLAAGVAALASFLHRHDRPDRLTLLAALCAVMLAAMSVPIGPLGHLSFAPMVGILLGPGLGFLAAALVNGTLALLGHGGLTVVGLNTCVLGAAMVVARPAYRLLRTRLKPGRAGALATIVALAVSVVALCVVVALATRDARAAAALAGSSELQIAGVSAATGRFVLFSSPFWLIGIVAEALVTSSVLSYLARVRPELLP
jgi:cobalt/nickel transport system permease protein